MPRYRVSYEIEADDSDGAVEVVVEGLTRLNEPAKYWTTTEESVLWATTQWQVANVHVELLDEPEPEEDCEDGWPKDADMVKPQEEN